MSTTLLSDIEQSIKKNLPEQIGEALKKELAELKDLRQKAQEDKTTISSHLKTIEDLDFKVSDLERVLNLHEDIRIRLEGIEKREKDLDVTLLKYKNEMLEQTIGKMDAHTALLLRNAELRKQVWAEHKEPVLSCDSDAAGNSTTRYIGDQVTTIPKTESEEEV